MINVPIDKIVPLTTARDTLSKIVSEVETKTPLYVLTKGGKPSVAVVNIEYLEKALSGSLSFESDQNAEHAMETTGDELKDEAQPSELFEPPERAATIESPAAPRPTDVPTPSQEEAVITPGPSPVSSGADEPLAPPPVNPPQPIPPPLATQPEPSSTPNIPPPPVNPPVDTTPSLETPPIDSQPPSASPTPSATPPTEPNPQIALGSMDGIQSKPFTPPAPPPPVPDPNASVNPAQYPGPSDPQAGGAGTNEPADMVID